LQFSKVSRTLPNERGKKREQRKDGIGRNFSILERQMENRKRMLQTSDFGDLEKVAEERKKKMWDHLDKQHEKLKSWLEERGMILPQKNKEENKK
jgi:hypothetical protein